VAVITRTGLIRIIRLTRIRFSRSFVDSACASNLTGKKNEHPSKIRVPATRGRHEAVRSASEARTRVRCGTGPAGGGWGSLRPRFQQEGQASHLPGECQPESGAVALAGASTTSRNTMSFPSRAGTAKATVGSCSKTSRQPPATASARSRRLLSSVRRGSRS
jgi:hypothetical protein